MPIFALRTTANREDQVVDFVSSNVQKKGLNVFCIIKPHGLLPNIIEYKEIENMLEQVKTQVNIQKNDVVEIISGPFAREKAKVSRINMQKEEVVVELLEAAVPIPITVKLDSVKVIRREEEPKR